MYACMMISCSVVLLFTIPLFNLVTWPFYFYRVRITPISLLYCMHVLYKKKKQYCLQLQLQPSIPPPPFLSLGLVAPIEVSSQRRTIQGRLNENSNCWVFVIDSS